MLILLGVFTLRGVSLWVRESFLTAPNVGFHGHSHGTHATASHLHTHAHGDYAHSHVHGHGTDDHGHSAGATPQAWIDRKLSGLSAYQKVRPLVIGVVHGLAGSAAVALLILSQIREPLWAVIYLVLFGVGTIAGMMLITSVIAVPFAYSVRRFPHLNIWMRLSAGVLSLGFGLYLAYHIGFQNGLFMANPQWTPG
jgi:high-affinity nickel-transport protein